MSKLKSWRCTVDLISREIERTDRVIIIMQGTTPGQCVMKVVYLFDNDKFEARMVGTPVEIKGVEQAVLFTT